MNWAQCMPVGRRTLDLQFIFHLANWIPQFCCSWYLHLLDLCTGFWTFLLVYSPVNLQPQMQRASHHFVKPVICSGPHPKSANSTLHRYFQSVWQRWQFEEQVLLCFSCVLWSIIHHVIGSIVARHSFFSWLFMRLSSWDGWMNGGLDVKPFPGGSVNTDDNNESPHGRTGNVYFLSEWETEWLEKTESIYFLQPFLLIFIYLFLEKQISEI